VKIEINNINNSNKVEVDYHEFFRIVAKPIIARYYKIYKSYYLRKIGGLRDVEQEVLLSIWLEVEKNKGKKKPLAGTSLGRYLTVIVKRKLLYLKRTSQDFYYEKLAKSEKNIKGSHTNLNVKKNVQFVSLGDGLRNYIDIIPCQTTLDSKDYLKRNLFPIIKDICREKDYTIIYSRFHEGLTFQEIGKLLNMSKEAVYQRYIKTIKKISEKNKNLLNFRNFPAIIYMKARKPK